MFKRKKQPREWIEIRGWDGSGGMIPADALVAMGIDPASKTGTRFFTAEESRRMHQHPEWEQLEQKSGVATFAGYEGLTK